MWTVTKLNAVLTGNLVGGPHGHLHTFGCIQWVCELFNGRPKARCYPFDMPGHRFRNKNPKVTPTYTHIHIYCDISYTISCTISYTIIAKYCILCRTVSAWLPHIRFDWSLSMNSIRFQTSISLEVVMFGTQDRNSSSIARSAPLEQWVILELTSMFPWSSSAHSSRSA